MAIFTFNPADYEESNFEIIPAGDHRARINEVTEKTFKSGNTGFEITLDISGYGSKLWLYLVIDSSDTKKTNQRFGDFFNSFGITDYNLAKCQAWRGKLGAVRVKHEEYNGEQRAKAAFCISRAKQDKLPAWKENGNGSITSAAAIDENEFELPFDR